MFDKHTTHNLLQVQTKLRVRMIDQGQLSTRDSLLYLKLTETLDQRAARKDRELV